MKILQIYFNVLLVLSTNSLLAQKIELIDGLNEKILVNKEFLLNDIKIKTDENGFFEANNLDIVNTVKVPNYEIYNFSNNSKISKILLNPISININEVEIKNINSYSIIKNLNSKKITFSIKNNATLVNYVKIPDKHLGKEIYYIEVKIDKVNCAKSIFLKPVIYSVKNNLPDVLIDSSDEIYEVSEINKNVKLRFHKKLPVFDNEYYIGIEILDINDCEKPYSIFSKISKNFGYMKITNSKLKKWYPNSSSKEKKFINIGIDIFLRN